MFTQIIEGPLWLAGIQRAHLVSGRRSRQEITVHKILSTLIHKISSPLNIPVDILVSYNLQIDTLEVLIHIDKIEVKIQIYSFNCIYIIVFCFSDKLCYLQKIHARTIYIKEFYWIYSFLFNICHFTAYLVLSILCSLYEGTLVTYRTTAHTLPSFKNYSAFVLSIIFVTTLTIASKCYASTNAYQNVVKLHRYSKSSSSPIVTTDLIIRINSSKLVLSKSYDNLLSGVKGDTSIIVKNSKQLLYNRNLTILQKTDRFRSKREYLATFDNIISYYHDRKEVQKNKRVTTTNAVKSRSINFRKNLQNYSKLPVITVPKNVGNISGIKNVSESASNTTADELRVKNSLEIIDRANDVSYEPPVKKNFQFELSTQRSMPPAHVSENSLNDSSVLVLVVSVVVLTVTLGLVTCVLSHYRGGTAANSHDAAQTPTTAPMLSVVSAGAAAGVGGMDRLCSRGTARELVATRDRQVRVHAVHTDIAINLPPSISLPDGEDHPFNSRLQIRDAEQEAEIYQKCIKPPPNRTVLESESPPPYRSSSAGLLGSISGSSSSSTDWSGGSTPLVVRCHSMSSTSKRQETTSGGQKTDFIQRTVKRFTGKKNQPLSTATTTNVVPVVIVPTKPRRISEQQQHPQQQPQTQQNSTTGRPKPNV